MSALATPWTIAALAEQVERRPDAPAVVADSETMTYSQLWRRAGRVTQLLRGAGVEPGGLVALAAVRGGPFIAAALGSWLAGCAYVPLDTMNPTLRMRLIVDSARPAAVLTSPPFDGLGNALGLDELSVPAVDDGAATNPPPAPHSADPAAYVMYTSGTTGTPKGVVVGHSSLANLVRWFATKYHISSSDRCLHTVSVGFDASMLEIWPFLVRGGCVVACSDERRFFVEAVIEQMARERCTATFLGTPLAEEALASGRLPDSLRVLACGGAQLRLPVPAPTTFTLANLYGPTEATVVTTAHHVVDGAPGDLVPIGRPIDGGMVALCDENGAEVPAGETGELYVGGAPVAHGYLHDPELTAAKFVTLPDRAGRWYRTGDLARWDGDAVTFLGRVNQEQLKVRGVRVDATEIEAALLAVEDVSGAAVTTVGHGTAGELVAVLVTRGDSGLTERSLRRSLVQRLPANLLPRRYIFAERLPLTLSGKIDRPALDRLVSAEQDAVIAAAAD